MTLLALLCLFSPNAIASEVVHLKNGDVYHGDVLSQEFGKKVQLRFQDGTEKSIPWNDVESIQKEATTEPPAAAPSPAVAEPPAAPAPPPAPAPAPAPPVAAPEPEKEKNFWAYLGIGATVSNSSTYSLDQPSSALTANDSAGAGPLINFEFFSRLNPFLGLSGILEVSRYNYDNNSTEADTEIAALVMPRVQTTGPHGHLWAGFAAGYVHTQVGLVARYTSTYTLHQNPFAPGFAISPRVGADFEFQPGMSLGFEAFYMSGNGIEKGSVSPTNGGMMVLFTEHIHRSWIGLAARGGFAF